MTSTAFLQTLSQVFGWIYVICWSASFYPQPFLNWQRQSTTGVTIDFAILNTVGFAAYFISNTAFLYSPVIRAQYASRNHGHTPTVRFNDLAFAGHAFFLSILFWSQFFPSIWGFDKGGRKGPGGRGSQAVLGLCVGAILGVLIVVLIVAGSHGKDPATDWAWIDVVYAVSYIKLIITFVKYCPQVHINYTRQSTHGFSIATFVLDFSGGVLSNLQLFIDSYLQNDWSGVTGNPVKLALANFSIFFDIIFFVQHFCLYRGARGKLYAETEEDEDETDQEEPLLRQSDRRLD